MQSQTAIQVAQSDSPVLRDALTSLNETLFSAARSNLQSYLGDEFDHYSDLQKRAMVATEALRLTGGLELSTLMTRYAIIKQIEDEGLTGVHPNGFANLTELAKENGVSVGELSDVRTLCEVVFPYITDVLGLSIVDMWEKIGKSGFREMAPALRSLITAENASHNSVRQAVEQMLNNAGAEMMNDEDEPWSEEELSTQEGQAEMRSRAVRNLLSLATSDGMTVRQMRRAVRPSSVPHVPMATLQIGEENWYAILRITTQEQLDLVQRVLNSHVDNMNLSMQGDTSRNYRRTLGSLFGDQNDQ